MRAVIVRILFGFAQRRGARVLDIAELGDALLLQSTDYLLLESGDKLLLE
jgi:hypothetical protein